MVESLRKILLMHAEKYPLAEPTDLLKLVYQAAFGPGHLISDRALATAYIDQEMQTAKAEAVLLEPIGGGYARLYLGAARESRLSPEEIASRFFLAAEQKGSPALFDEMIAELMQLCSEGQFAFSSAALRSAIDAWETDGRPLFRHSETYRNAYAPAYRLVLVEESCS